MVTLFAMLAVVVSMVHAQKVYASVYQRGGNLRSWAPRRLT